MMALADIVVVMAAGGVVVTGALAVLFALAPGRGMAIATHRKSHLPLVLADRYAAFCLLAIAAVIYRDLNVIAVLFAVFAFMGIVDAWLYARDGHPCARHLIAGLLAALVSATALAATLANGAIA
ncbi:hypothetical protein C2I36_02550 [Rhodobacteraceae bacterium WD3A24]|nr:hypothetical protein C2I36_02550 [Rhodobacteraceae bacterium WD3A24]